MSREYVKGPIFFETTITTEVYHDIIQQFTAILHKDEYDVIFEIMSGHMWGKTRCPLWQNFLGSKFASGCQVAQI